MEAYRCCHAVDAPHQFAPSAAARSRETLGPSVGAVELAPEPDIADCYHEAAHAALAVALGASVIALRGDGQPFVRHEPVARSLDAVVVALGGMVAQRWRLRHFHSAPDDLIAGYASRSAFGGTCDHCAAVRALRKV